MANWISSKLKVAENLLQQIDQQAAESLRKGERPSPRSSDEEQLKLDTTLKVSSSGLSLKDQVNKKKKKKESLESSDYYGKVSSDINRNASCGRESSKVSGSGGKTVSDGDWTELLSTPSQGRGGSGSGSGRVDGVPGINAIRGLKREGKKVGGGKGSVGKFGRRSSGVEERKESSGESGSSSSGLVRRLSSGGLRNDVEERGTVSLDSEREVLVEGNDEENEGLREGNEVFSSKVVSGMSNEVSSKGVSGMENEVSPKGVLGMGNESSSLGSSPGKVDDVRDSMKGVDVGDRLRSVVRGKHESNAADSESSDEGSDSGSDSGSTSESEDEREREERRRKREKILAEKAAARAVEFIKEHENMVARLEGEKESLEKILEERAKQQAKEASELQTTMMETMEAADIEKQKHNNTRMEAFARLAKLETANAELARSLAAAQKNLEVEVKRVGELRQQFESKEVGIKELSARMSRANQAEKPSDQLMAAKGVQFERDILEAEYSFLRDKVRQLQDKAKTLEVNIETTRKEMEEPTEVEIELKRRLGQLTDHLIQKQVQVESLSSEKATLLFRIEAVTRLLDDNKASDGSSSSFSGDLESGTWEFSKSKLRPLIEDRIHSGREHLGSVLRQLESIFLVGSLFLKRNSTARLWAVVYLICLHIWVIYILMSHSQTSDGGRSGAVISLENINNTAGG